ncbi:unnamed protein product, partial [Iphiclides podalirius]
MCGRAALALPPAAVTLPAPGGVGNTRDANPATETARTLCHLHTAARMHTNTQPSHLSSLSHHPVVGDITREMFR